MKEASFSEDLMKLLERLRSSLETEARLRRLRMLMPPSRFLICLTTSLQFVMSISVTSLAT